MKKFSKLIVFVLLLSFFVINLSGCYGGFTLTRRIHKWNDKVENKYKRTLTMWLLLIIPVYEFCITFDLVILNSLEFWFGINPLSLDENDKEVRIIEKNNKTFQITVTQNQYCIDELNSKGDPIRSAYLIYEPEQSKWFIKSNGKKFAFATMEEENPESIEIILPSTNYSLINSH